MRIPSLIVLAFNLAAVPALADGDGPSFDCAKPTTAVEEAICASPDLAALDVELAAFYEQALAVADGLAAEIEGAPDKLRAAQRDWIARRDGCSDTEDVDGCVADAYRDRLAVIKLAYGLLAPGSYPVEKSFEGFEGVPEPVMAAVRENPDCDLEFVSPSATVYDLDLGWQLYEVACWSAAYNFGSAFVLVPYGRPDEARTVTFDGPPDMADETLNSLTLPAVDISTGEIASFHKGRGPADCGTYRRQGWNGTDRVVLLELRIKEDCDGEFVDPPEYPLVYRAW